MTRPRATAPDAATDAATGAARPAVPAPVLRVRGLVVRYGEVTALDGVDLTVPAGRVTALVGMNGAGKSTLFRAVTGLVRPVAGSVEVLGRSPEQARRAALVGYVPQSEEVDWDFPLSVRDVVMTGRYGRLGPTRRPRKEDRAAVAGALERVGLTDLADRQIGALSGGQRKRVFVARGLAQEAPLLLLDEPFAGVDQRSVRTLTALLRDLAAEGRGVLVSTHDLQSLTELCDEAVLLRRRVLLHAPPEEVLRPEQLARAFGVDPAEVER